MIKNIVLILLLGLFLAAGVAFPQAAHHMDSSMVMPGSSDSLANMSIEDLMKLTVTTASKKSETVAQTPASASIITHEDIERWGYRTLAECLQRIAGFYTTNDSNYTYMGVRGFGRAADYNSRLLILLDGHRLNELVFDYAAAGFEFPIDINSVERIEIIKGPGSALWGTNALLAVINVVTFKSDTLAEPLVTFRAGSPGVSNMAVQCKGSSGDFKLAGSLSTYSSSGRNNIYYPAYDDPSTNNGIAEDLDSEYNGTGYLQASYKNISLMYTRGKRTKYVPTNPFGADFNAPDSYTTDDRSFLELTYEGEVHGGNNGKLMARVSQDVAKYEGIFPYGDIPNRDYVDSRWFSGEIRYSSDLSDKLSSIVGIEYLKSGLCERGNYDPDPYTEYFFSSTKKEVYSGYIQFDYNLRPDLRLVAGTRMDHYNTFGTHWNPRAALVYTPDDRTSWKLLYGMAFRAPNDANIYGLSSTNPDLKPEDITTLELVWERETSPGTRLQASAYQYDMKGIISGVLLDDDVVHYVNIDTVKSKGLELQIESYLKNDVTAYAGISLSDTTMRDDWISNSPRITASGGVSLPIFAKKALLTSEAIYVGNRRTSMNTDAGSKTLVNLILKTAKPWCCTNVRLGVYNLFDADVYDTGSTANIQDKLPLMGRTFELQISRSF